MSTIKKLVQQYYSPHDKEYLESIRKEIFTNASIAESEVKYKKHGDYINSLKGSFRNLVLARNKLAEKYGYKDYFSFISEWDKIPPKN
jgi:hypothetical protein